MLKISIMILLIVIILFLIYKFLQPKDKEFFYRKFRNPGDGPSDSQIARNRAVYAEQQRQESLKTQEQKDAEKAAKDSENARINSDITSALSKRDKAIQDAISNIKLTNTASWLKAFIVQNDAAKKFGNRLRVSDDRHLYLDDKDLGYSDDFPNHVGNLRDNTGYYVPIEAIFTLIAGPDDSKDECFDFLGIGGAITSAANTVAGGITSGYDWTKDRVNDATNFADKAVNSVGDWAKNLSSEVLNWCKTVGQNFARSLIDFGNKIGCVARKIAKEIANTVINTLNTIKDFFGDLAQKAKDAFESGFNWIKNNMGEVWDKVQPVIGGFINIILEGSACEYMISRKLSKLEAVIAIAPAIVPKLRVIFLDLIKKGIEAVSAGILFPFIELLMPIIESITPIDSKIDDLLTTIVKQDFAVVAITAVADNTVGSLVSKYCSSFEEPNIDDINFSTPKDIVVSDSDKNLFNDL